MIGDALNFAECSMREMTNDRKDKLTVSWQRVVQVCSIINCQYRTIVKYLDILYYT